MTFVFGFDHEHARPPMEMKDLLGGKGANLAEMTSVLDLPVPPGFTISTDASRAYMVDGWPGGLDDEVADHLARLEKSMGKRLGDAADPLLVSVRSGAKFSMPGMMDTVLNLGLNDESVKGLAQQTNDERFANDSYRRFIQMYGKIVLDIPGEEFDELFEAARERSGVASDAEIPADALAGLISEFKVVVEKHTGKPFPQEPRDQLRGAIEAVFNSWNSPRAVAYRRRERIPDDLGTAVNVQTMVFGNRDNRSGTGVGFTRNPATGEAGAYGDFLINAQGEDVVAGIRNTLPLADMKQEFPTIYDELLDIFERLELHYRDMLDTEFTIDQDKLWMLQTRVGKRTGAAALRIAVALTERFADPAHRRRSRACASTPSTSTRCCIRSSRRPTQRCSVRAWRLRRAPPSARRTSTPTGAPRRPSGASRSSWCARRRRPRTCTAWRSPKASSRRAVGWSATPRWSHADGASPRCVAPRAFDIGADTFTTNDGTVVQRGRRHLDRRQHRPDLCGRGEAGGGQSAGGVRGDPRLGRRDPQGSTWAFEPTPTPVRTPLAPGTSAPRASACAAPSTCSWAIGCRSCAP